MSRIHNTDFRSAKHSWMRLENLIIIITLRLSQRRPNIPPIFEPARNDIPHRMSQRGMTMPLLLTLIQQGLTFPVRWTSWLEIVFFLHLSCLLILKTDPAQGPVYTPPQNIFWPSSQQFQAFVYNDFPWRKISCLSWKTLLLFWISLKKY
jgi:hypothetical protein